MSQSGNSGLGILGLFLAIGLLGGGYFVSTTLYKSHVGINTASVKGLAEREVKSDLAVWNIYFSSQAADLQSAYKAGESSRDTVKKFMLDRGFDESEMRFTLSADTREFREKGILRDRTYVVSVNAEVRSENVDRIEATHRDTSELIGKGILISNSPPQYLYTKLNDIKPELLQEATRNARLAASQFAEDAGAKVGTIRSANQGAFSIASRDGGATYGEDRTSMFKKVRVVTTISFFLDN